MTFDELKNGMKSLFSSLGAKTSDSNYAVGLYDKTSAEPKGIMAMSNLASVLGGATLQITTQNYDLNNAPYGRIGSSNGDISQTLTHAPEQGRRSNFVCTTYKCDDADKYKVQEFVYTSASSNNPTKYIRKCHYNIDSGYTWGSWYQMYDTSLLTSQELLSPLASALGVGAFKSTHFKMLYGAVTTNSETSIPCGDGLLFIGLYSGGVLIWPTYWDTTIEVVAGAYPSGITATKTSGSRVIKVNNPSSTEYQWVYLGFTA